MVVQDHRAVVELLAAPSTHGGVPVERIETHSAVVFLAGTRAWKLKRAVRYDYLDFSTPERRRLMCEAEVRLNRRTAPQLYLGVVPVVRRPDGALALGGPGEAIDWVIEMTRFDQSELCDRRAAEGRLDVPVVEALARAISALHAAAERRFDHGGAAAMHWVIQGNSEGFASFGSSFLEREACERLTRMQRDAVRAHAGLLDARRADGFVRQCHGDLHLRNVVMLFGQPTLFDAIEFNDELACIDVMYDLSFLLMDLIRRGLPRHANALFNRYLRDTTDLGGLPLLPLFLSCRAAIRAKTSATSAAMASDAARGRELGLRAREYLELAERLLRPVPPALIAIGGLSGTGKSTLALALAPETGGAPGAVVLRSDEIRKALCGVPALAALAPGGYTADVSARVYSTLVERATRVLRAGHSVIVDAVAAREGDRDAIEHAAAAAGAPFVGLWLDAPVSALVQRADARQADASDADGRVVRMQAAQPPGRVRWRRLDATPSTAVVLERARKYLSTRPF